MYIEITTRLTLLKSSNRDLDLMMVLKILYKYNAYLMFNQNVNYISLWLIYFN